MARVRVEWHTIVSHGRRRWARRTATLLVGMLLAGGASRALASEQSELLAARGLMLYNQQKFGDALALFDQAVAADPGDVYARYYRGLAQARLGNYAAAVDDLQTAVDAKPTLTDGALELGIALVEIDRASEAVPYLERAQGAPALTGQASLWLGIAQLREGEPRSAAESFARAGADPTLQTQATFYKGVAAYQAGNWGEAGEYFRSVSSLAPDTDMGREAAAYLTAMAAGDAEKWDREWRVYGRVGLAYDSNVGLFPTTDTAAVEQFTGVSGQADGRAVISLGGLWMPWRNDTAELSVGYDYFQTAQFKLTEYDLLDNRVNAQLAARVDPVQMGLYTSYDYYLLDFKSFLQMPTVMPWVIFPIGDLGRTEVSYRYRYRDFFGRHLNIDYGTLYTASNQQPGIRQFLYLGDPSKVFMLGYRFNNWLASQTAGQAFNFNGQQVSAALGWPLPWDVTGDVGYAFEYQDYYMDASRAVPWGPRRRDNLNEVFAVLSRPISEHFDVALAYYGFYNDSNQSAYTYNRSIVSVTIGAWF